MSSYTISPTLNKSRVFILQKSELEKRFDPFFYIPELLELEKKVLAKKPKKLRDYVKGLASGATPKRDEEDKYYSDKENGIPFLRVQNVTEFGLDLTDVKFINKKTHEGYLKRSQISEGDLIVTITGRIASAAVAPDGFIGNTNQHSVVIKTGSKEISEKLAAYLNCSIGQKLANRLATGGTRPALDYPALLSIPIIEDKRILQINDKVIAQKQKNEAEADKLLSSIDEYLLKELGIKLPEPPENTLKNRMFSRTLKEISNNRFDPFYHKEEFAVLDKILDNKMFVKFSTLIQVITKGETPLWKGESYVENGIPFLKVQNISSDGIFGEITYITEELHNSMTRSILKGGELLYTMAGSIGIATYLPIDFGEANINQAIAKIILKDNLEIDKSFLLYVINSKVCKKQAERFLTVSAQPNINFDQIKAIKIPVPPLDKQKEIAEHITSIRQQAQQLKDKTTELLIKASKEIEEILLN